MLPTPVRASTRPSTVLALPEEAGRCCLLIQAKGTQGHGLESSALPPINCMPPTWWSLGISEPLLSHLYMGLRATTSTSKLGED